MKVLFFRDRQELKIIDEEKNQKKIFYCDSVVRNEINGERQLHKKSDVVTTIPVSRYETSLPYMPRPFPLGEWLITGFEFTDQTYFQPVKLLTNAQQLVPIWALDTNGGYDHAAGNMQFDYGYWFHYWGGRTTLGCGRFDKVENILTFLAIIKPYLDVFKTVPLEVV